MPLPNLNFYVKTIEVVFNINNDDNNDGYSPNQALYKDGSLLLQWGAGFNLDNVWQKSYFFQGNTDTCPQYQPTGSINFVFPRPIYFDGVPPYVPGYQIRWDTVLERNKGVSGWSDVKWISNGWSSPLTDFSTYVGMLLDTFSRTIFQTTSTPVGDLPLISNDFNYNLIVYKYKFLDSPGDGAGGVGWSFFPIITPGNDSNCDFTLTA